MKIKSIILFVGLFLSGVSNATIINYGHTSYLGLSSTHGANFLLGESIYVDQDVNLLAAGIIFTGSGGYNANVGIYTDNAGSPDQLVATTGSFFVSGAGTLETSFTTSPTVTAGTYWFMAIYDSTANIGYSSTGGTVLYDSMTFTSTLPTSLGSMLSFTGQDYNYYMQTSAVPVPAAIWLFGTGLLGLIGVARKPAADKSRCINS